MSSSIPSSEIERILSISKAGQSNTPEICIETGTYQGVSTLKFADQFKNVHTIELSEKWYAFAKERFTGINHINPILGDSAAVLAELVPGIESSVFFFLDAHFAGGDTAFGEQEVPLLEELGTICQRQQQDIVVIDDARLFGKKGISGGKREMYPRMEFDWREITNERIGEIANKGINNVFWLWRDKLIIFRNRTFVQGVLLLGLTRLKSLSDFIGQFWRRGIAFLRIRAKRITARVFGRTE